MREWDLEDLRKDLPKISEEEDVKENEKCQ